MNNYPSGKKMIFHNGWWHGNNAAFIRLIQDSATIIVLGNKYNRGIYHAKDLSSLFGNYFGAGEEDELEASISNAPDSIVATPKVAPKKIVQRKKIIKNKNRKATVKKTATKKTKKSKKKKR